MDANTTLEELRALSDARKPAELVDKLVAIARAWPAARWPQVVVDYVVETFGEHRRWSGYLRGKEKLDMRDAEWVALMPWRERAVVGLFGAIEAFEEQCRASLTAELNAGLGEFADDADANAHPDLSKPAYGRISAEGWARDALEVVPYPDHPDTQAGRVCLDGDVVFVVEDLGVEYAFSEHVEKMQVTFWAPITEDDAAVTTDIAWVPGGDDIDPPFSTVQDWGKRVAEAARVAERYDDSWE